MARLTPTMDVSALLATIYRGRYVVAGAVAVCVLIAVAFSVMATPQYTSSASILLKFGREFVYRPEVGDEQPAVPLDREQVVNSELEILRSSELAREAVRRVGVKELYPGIDRDPEFLSRAHLREIVNGWLAHLHPNLEFEDEDSLLDRATNAFRGGLEVAAVGNSDMVRISFTHEDRRLAAKAVSTVVETFKEKRLEIFSDPQTEFLDQQVQQFETRLREREQAYEEFRQSRRVYDLGQQRSLLLEQRSRLSSELKAAENRIDETAEAITSLEKERAGEQPRVPVLTSDARDPVVSEAKRELLQLRLEEQELLAKYLDSSEFVADVREQIELVEQFLQDHQDATSRTQETGVNEVYQELTLEIQRTRAQHNSAVAKRDSIRVQMEQIDEEIAKLDRHERELHELQREIETARNNYKIYVNKLEEARISEDLNQRKMVNVSLVEPANPPLSPSSPRKVLNVAMGLLFGLGSGFGTVMLGGYLRPQFSNAESVQETLQLPVIGTLDDRKH